jgi:hypothetical protein
LTALYWRSGLLTVQNPPISRWLVVVLVVALLVVVDLGVSLFFLPELTRPVWMWAITPFNGSFLGAVYLSAIAPVGMALATRRWAPTRVVLPMMLVFTSVLLVTSLVHFNRFRFDVWGTWLWFGLYLALPATLGWFLWRYRRWPPALATPTAPPLRALLVAEAAVLALYGAGLIVAPTLAAGFWPWPIDAFHGQLYSAAFLAPAIGAAAVARLAARIELATLGLTALLLGALPIVGLALGHLATGRVDWAAPGVWAWIAGFSALALSGLVLIGWSSLRTSPRIKEAALG